jgi:phosphoribulokinase
VISRVSGTGRRRPVLLAIAGDSAAGKTTLASGLVAALGPDRCAALSTDDYQRFDRAERRGRPHTAVHPDSSYINILGQHLQLLASGQPILKPGYDHTNGRLTRPELVEPRDFIVVEGLLALHAKLVRACFDSTVFLDPPERTRIGWKLRRDTSARGYTADQVLAELAAREPESRAYIRPQREYSDIVVRFAEISGRQDPPGTPLAAEVLFRPMLHPPDLAAALAPGLTQTIHPRATTDTNGRPVDCLHVHGYPPRHESDVVEKALWDALDMPAGSLPDCLGRIATEPDSAAPAAVGAAPEGRSAPLAIVQLLLLHQLFAIEV